MTRRTWIIVGMILVFLVGGLWIVGSLRNGQSAATQTAGRMPTGAAAAEAAVAAKGSIAPLRYARLSFATSGTVAQVLVKEGDKVKAGDVLAQLDTGDLKLQLQAAQDALDVAELTLKQAKTPATPDEIAAAEANLRNARAQHDRAKGGATGAELAIALANLQKAEAAVQQAQAAYDRIGGASNPMIGMTPQALALQAATQDYQIAKANYDLKVKADAATLAAAEAAVFNAQAVLDLKKSGARQTDLAIGEARTRQAKTALEQAKAALAKATLTAPFDATVTSVAIRQGETINAGTTTITIADISQWRVETTDLDEWGAARVKIGQTAKVRVNAFASKVLTGKVVQIASQSTTLSTGDVAYVVTIALDQVDPDVRWGMTVKVEFQKQ
jgi:multidrug efflux pump subunit AcrA (membrane-fusion protein)